MTGPDGLDPDDVEMCPHCGESHDTVNCDQPDCPHCQALDADDDQWDEPW